MGNNPCARAAAEPQPLPVDAAALNPRAYNNDDEGLALCPAHAHGDIVEYYSPTHKIWLIGIVQLSTEKSEVRGFPVFVYNVRLRKSGQVRHDVPLDMIRAPFQPTELVEVFSKRNGGQWMLASILGKAPGNICKGYTVRVEETGGTPEMQIDKTPSWRIRRRFPARISIEVYRGPILGWVRSVVHSVVSAFPAEPPVPLSPWSPGTGTAGDIEESSDSSDDASCSTAQPRINSRTMLEPRPTADAKTQWLRDDAATICGSTVAGEDGMMVHPWVQVPVYVEEWDEFDWGRDPDVERAQWVPSYLLRMNMAQLASSKEYDRRSFAV